MIEKILQQLNRQIGVKGSMVVGPDGLVVTSELGDELDMEVVAAMASNTIRSSKRALNLLGNPRFDRFILISAYGRIVFVDIDPAILLVVTDKNINIDFTMMEIEGAAHRIKNSWKM
jgi:predicted regulator of Ras-like GTPase activity (Roadblock/LC7/MglB family)